MMIYVFIMYWMFAILIWFYFIGSPTEVGFELESEVVDDDFKN